MKWEELEERLKSVSKDGVEADLSYYGGMDDAWLFELSNCKDVGMIARPHRVDDMHSLRREDMIRLRDFLLELLPIEGDK